MTEQRRPRLASPFKITKQISKGGKSFTYIPNAEVTDRLNTVLGVGQWSYEVQAFRDGNWIIAHGRLEACGGAYEQYGGVEIKTFNSEAKKGEPVDLGDEYKGAASDAFKKCAQAVGVGIYLALERVPLSAQFEGVSVVEEGGAQASGTATSTDLEQERAAGGSEGSPAAASDPGRPFSE